MPAIAISLVCETDNDVLDRSSKLSGAFFPQHTILAGDIGAFNIDPDHQIQLPMVAAHAPLIDPDFLDVLEYPAQLTVEGNGR
jgi:hypothetical protein